VLIEQAVSKRIAAVGVTDYFSIEGYKQLKAFVESEPLRKKLVGSDFAAQSATILFLPNIEFRSSIIVARPDGSDSRVNFHVIFSDEVDAEFIEEHFLRELEFTAESNPDSADERWSLTIPNLKELGKKLKGQHSPFRKYDDLFVGMMNAVVAHEDVTNVLSRQASRFKNRYLLAVAADEDLSACSWNGQGHLSRKLFIRKSHMLFSSNPGTIQFALGKKHESVDDFIREFGKVKPCIHGSDAHDYGTLFEPAQHRYMWIKADPTFQGLRQLLYEPESRAYVGEEPPSLIRVRDNATRYMNEVRFARTEFAQDNDKWFSGIVPLNQGLVAIIGNKGSGKSALADILALLGNTSASASFSFLTQDRFLTPKTGFGSMFRGDLIWRSGKSSSHQLDEPVDRSAPELVKYIPQNYLEAICGELKESSNTAFDLELMGVIYSHVGRAERLGTDTLAELIDHLTSERQATVSLLTKELEVVNKDLVTLEAQLTDEYKKSLEGQVTQRKSELDAHHAARPPEIKEPDKDPEAQEAAKSVADEIAELQTRAAALDSALGAEQDKLERSAMQIAASNRLLSRLDNLERMLASFDSDSEADCQVLGVNIRQIVQLQITREPVTTVKAAAETKNDTAKRALDQKMEGSFAYERQVIQEDIGMKRLALDEPTRRYQEYLQEMRDWELRHAEIDGASDKPLSVKGLEAKIIALQALPARIAEQRRIRMNVVKEIFGAKRQLLEDYRRLYRPVQEFINEHPVSKQQGALQFSASMAVDGLVEGLLEKVHQGRRGSFQHEVEGRERLKQLVRSADFTTELGVEAFLGILQEHFEKDKGDPEEKPVRLQEQLRQAVSVQEVYDFTYSLSFLKPRFELRWQGKPLDKLSPGERGTLLLIFYLLIDKREMPLIIDQPEENLDNQTIATMLVPAIRFAKDRRQIIIVTHNPNLAVVCDAEQIIHARIDKADGNQMIYAAGSIENASITQLIVDVLEGTMPAFDLRDARYEVLERLS